MQVQESGPPFRHMAAEEITITLDADTLERARDAAERAGLSLEQLLAKLIRRQTLHEGLAAFAEWVAANPDVRAELEAWDAMTVGLDEEAWAKYGEAM